MRYALLGIVLGTAAVAIYLTAHNPGVVRALFDSHYTPPYR